MLDTSLSSIFELMLDQAPCASWDTLGYSTLECPVVISVTFCWTMAQRFLICDWSGLFPGRWSFSQNLEMRPEPFLRLALPICHATYCFIVAFDMFNRSLALRRGPSFSRCVIADFLPLIPSTWWSVVKVRPRYMIRRS